MASTTSSAGPLSEPEPSVATPGSFTTTFAPSAAANSATPRPMPRPAPVTTTALPSSMPMAVLLSSSRGQGDYGRAGRSLLSLGRLRPDVQIHQVLAALLILSLHHPVADHVLVHDVHAAVLAGHLLYPAAPPPPLLSH